MAIGTSLLLIAVGAIFYWALEFDVVGLDIDAVGVIFMVVGVIGLLITLIMMLSADRSPYGRDHGRRERVVERERPPRY